MSIDSLIKTIKTNNRFGKKRTVNTNLIKRAYAFAVNAHKGQTRASGEKYIIHCLATAAILAKMGLDSAAIAAALLHDVVEDTNVSIKDIEKKFGKEIAFLVSGVTKLGKIKYHGFERQVENLKKIFSAMAKDIRIVIIKLADRLHNMQTLSALSRKKQKRIALETLEIYAPIAQRLGIGTIRGELEDLAFSHLYPKKYKWLLSKVKERIQEREKYLKKITPIIKSKLRRAGIKFLEIQFRAKHYYSLYKKLQRYHMDFSKIYDLIALRIIVPNREDCYKTLGVIHKYWKPLPGRIKDYISAPKPNGYQSLHTTVFCINGKITEFQIRTPKMHWEAEYGIAAEWTYQGESKSRYYGTKKSKIEWIKELRLWQKQIKKPKEFLKSLKTDFLRNRIFVLTPEGDVVNLPEYATPIDFAYQIHTEIGHRCAGAKVNGEYVPLNYPLNNGQIVEIMLKNNANPELEWLKIVKTNHAKSKIKEWFRKNIGKNKKPPHKSIKSKSDTKIQTNAISKNPTKFIYIKKQKIKNPSIKLAKCCNPQFGEPIIGYMKNSKNIVIHYHKCNKILFVKNAERIVQAYWKSSNKPQSSTIEILAKDRIGLISDITSVLAKLRINIINITASEPIHNIALGLLNLEIINNKQLEKIIENLKKIKGVWKVKNL